MQLDEMPLETLKDVTSYTRHLYDLASVDIAKAFSTKTRKYKQDLELTAVDVRGTRPFNLTFSAMPASAMTFLQAADQAFFILTTHRSGVQSVVEVSLPRYQVLHVRHFQLSSTSSEPLNRIKAIVHQGFLWMVIGSTSSKVISVACMDPTKRTPVEVLQSIPVEVLGDLHIFSTKNDLHLVVGEAGQKDSTLYTLQGKYFDRVEHLHLPTQEVRLVTGFPHEGYYYLVFGMATEGESVMCRFDPLLVTLNVIQRLGDPALTYARHFIDPLDRKLYLVTLPLGSSPRLYWWTHEQLQPWQVLESPSLDHTSYLASIRLHNLQILLILAHRSRLTFYTDDPAGSYRPTHMAETSCDHITNLVGVRINAEYVVAFLCHGNNGTATFQTLSLVLKQQDRAESRRSDGLLTCLEEVELALEARREDIEFLNLTLTTDPILTLNSSQTWEGPVSFLGGLNVAGHSSFTDTLSIRTSDDPTSSQSLAELATHTTTLQRKVQLLEQQSSRILYFTGNQTITAAVTTHNLTVNMAQFNTLKIHNLNGIPLPDYQHRYLLVGFNQVINATASFDSLVTETLSLLAPINGLQVTDLMRKSVQSQVVIGAHTYNMMTVGGISNPSSLDGSLIVNKINTSSIVRRDGGATTVFLGTKTFRSLNVLSTVNSRLVNGVDLQDLAGRIIYKDVRHQQTLAGSYSLAQLTVNGNVNVALINGVDLEHLNSVTVKTTGDFTIKGHITYMGSVTVRGDLKVGSVNDIPWSSYIDRSSTTLVTARFKFLSATVTEEIISDNINDLDLSEDVVLTDTNDVIQGRVTFLRDVVVTGEAGVLVGEGVTVNNIDISSLTSSSLPGFGGVLLVEEPVTFSRPLQASGNIVTTSLNGLLMEGIGNRNAVTAGSLNGKQMTDFLTFNTSQVLRGSYEFQDVVRVEGDLALGPGSTVNGVDVAALDASVLRVHGHQTVHSRLESATLITVGDLELDGRLNGIDYRTEYWRLDQTLRHDGHVSFLSKTIANRIAISGNLLVTRLNNMDVVAAARNLVLNGQDAVITSLAGLKFTAPLKVTWLNVTGKIDGVNLEDLLSRTLLKSGQQQVSGALVVTGAVHFANSLTLDIVNSRSFTAHLSDVVFSNSTGVISGHKTFLASVNILGNFNPATVNGVRVRDLSNLFLTRSSTQVIQTHYTFKSSITIQNLTSPVIDGVAMNDVLFINREGSLTGTTTFTHKLTIYGDVTIPTSGPSCDLSQLSNQTLGSDGMLRVYSNVRVERLSLDGSVQSSSPLLVGAEQPIQLQRFLDSLVLKSESQTISGKVLFRQPTRIIKLSVNSINDVNILELYKHCVLKDERTTIECDVEFMQPLKIDRLMVEGSVEDPGRGMMVNNANLTKLDKDAVRLHGRSYVVDGTKTFASMLSVEDMKVDGTVGGIAVGDLVSMTKNEVLQDVTFLAPITVEGNLKVNGEVDGVDLNKVFATRVSLSRPQTVYGNCVFESIRVLGDLVVESINDVKLSNLVLRTGGGQQVITGRKVFSGGLLVRGSMDAPIVNGVDILSLNRTVLRRDQNAVINTSVIFENIVVTNGDVVIGGSVGELNFHNLSQALSSFHSITSQQYSTILTLHAQVSNVTARNIIEARNMFVSLDHLARLAFTDLGFHGDLAWVTGSGITSPSLLAVTSCRCSCLCHRETRFYNVSADGVVVPESEVWPQSSTIYLSSSTLDLRIRLETRHV
ncbi:hypothetical protein Pmani_013124 [Petrolisthes manimaculis]|uniref:Uncharacterized protein n=1 Tax=Petrolisthes manimaculis TaxID=1843537 RepID=A0AAE1PVX3_9EUCA|nr:hypothetical protein Pmani_013124 [Petrolisthes manimaculis]